MTIQIPALPVAAVISAALLLSSCGKQEAVSDVPSSEELARQADAASKAIRDQASGADENSDKVDTTAMTSYTNALRGFTTMVPGDWIIDEDASDDNGRMYKSAILASTLKVGWTENREDADLKAMVKDLEDAGEGITGEYVKENEYRASGTLSEGQKTMQRILRKPDGTMVSAVFSYPIEQAAKIDPLAKQILDSLTLQP